MSGEHSTNHENVVAIDGPAGSGKSTVSRRVADELGFLYADTGAMYRAVTLLALEQNIAPQEEKELIRLAEKMDLHFRMEEGSRQRVYADGRDVTEAIRRPEVDKNVSGVSAVAGVRRAMVERQRHLLKDHPGARGLVMEGRDIGSVVFPKARWKFFLTASAEERAKRRMGDLEQAGIEKEMHLLQQEIENRDHMDSNRSDSPLQVSPDAVTIDTTGLSIDQVVSAIVDRVRQDHRAG